MLSSLRKPKTIVIRGNDELEYTFLVKGGEDLRQDQRVEQLFEIMNDILGQDAACSQRGLRLVTYQVIPMTPRSDYAFLFNNIDLFYIISNSGFLYSAQVCHASGAHDASTLLPLITRPFKSFLKPSQLPGEYTACAAKYVAH